MALHDILTQYLPEGFEHPRDYLVKDLVMAPPQWKRFPADLQLQWEKAPFGTGHKNQVPETSGVYTFVVSSGVSNHPAACCLIYVGKTEDQTFRERYANYLQERKRLRRQDRIKVANYLNLWDEHLWFYYAAIDDQNQIDRAEQELLKALLPIMNEQFPAEVRDAVKIIRG